MNSVQQSGYTILEVMIVMAISAAMFISAVIAFGGRQEEVQFTQAVRDFDSRMQDVINDISTGFFSNEGSISCTVPPVPSSGTPVLVVGNDLQGGSDDCVFIGKALQFSPDSEDDSSVYVYNIVGRRDISGSPVNNLEEARPKAVGPSVAGDFLDNEVAKTKLDWGLKVTRIVIGDTLPIEDYGSIGLFTSFSSTITSGIEVDQISNNQLVRYGGIPGTTRGQVSTSVVDAIDVLTSDSSASSPARYIDLQGNNPITICLENAGGDKKAALVIGIGGSTTTTVQFDDYDRALCGA